MPDTLAVNPLDRTCTEVLATDRQPREDTSLTTQPVTMSVRELADVPVFVLLGEPGMGKSETMKALAAKVDGRYITVNNFIVAPIRGPGETQPMLIDALDEARTSGDTTVWTELRKSIAQAQLSRFGIACRAADWNASDNEDLCAVTPGQTVRVFSLNPLTPEQRHTVLTSEGIADADTFEHQAESLGFVDMLGNPQSLQLLASAVKSRQDQWPENRRDAYEMACLELVKEPNHIHQQAQKKIALHSREVLLDAAGWLSALMLLSNCNEVSDETPLHSMRNTVWLLDVLDVLPANSFSSGAVQQVLKRPIFLTPGNSTYVHRTVAEYLAARYLCKRVAEGLLPSRVASLMLASDQYLVGNLRGLAGWLAALSEPMRSVIFQADPASVLTYGDLHLLSTLAKQALINQLTQQPSAHTDGNLWQQAPSHLPLVQADMRDFVVAWLVQFRALATPAPQQSMVAHVLLNALMHAPAEPLWEPTLLGLVRDEHATQDIRTSALDALDVHKSGPATLLALLDDLYQEKLHDPRGKLTDHLLQHLYPKHLRPSEVLRFLKLTRLQPLRLGVSSMFWSYHIEKTTSPELLTELMEAMQQATTNGLFSDATFSAASHDLTGLESLAVKAIETQGASLPAAQLARWLWMCLDWQTSPFGSLSQHNKQRLGLWLGTHHELIEPVLAHWVGDGINSWDVHHRLLSAGYACGMGAFWLKQAQVFQAAHETSKAKDCLETAVWWVNQPDSDITLDDIMPIAQSSSVLLDALAPLLISSLGHDNLQRRNWLQDKKFREMEAAREELNEKNRLYLLAHLAEVSDGKLLNYLKEAAWADLKDFGYGGHDAELLAQWCQEHPDLDAATRQGYRALLQQLTTEQAANAVNSRKNNNMWPFELPCLVAAQDMYAEEPRQLLQLGKERIQALLMLYFLHHISNTEWLLALVETHPDWVEEVWWPLCEKALRAKAAIRIPHLWLLAREPRTRSLALRMLPRLLAAWPTKVSELNFPEFAQLLEATLNICPPVVISDLVAQRLKKKSLRSVEKAYLVMAGLWIDPASFAPRIDALLLRKQITQSDLLGFIGHLRRYGDRHSALPHWNAATIGLLFEQFGPLCPSAYPVGTYPLDTKYDGRDFLYQLLSALRNDTSDVAESVLMQLSANPALNDWKRPLEECLLRQSQTKAEQAFALPGARQVALTLQNKTPANHADLMAVALHALAELQKALGNSSTNRVHRFWTVDEAGKRPKPPHRPEPECRNVIADWLGEKLNTMGISVTPEHQHGAQNQSDIVLRVQTSGQGDMLLPIEVKGDWNKNLWSAAYEQLAKKYASDPHCHGKGIYLVLWLGTNRGDASLQKHPNQPTRSAVELQERLQQETLQKTKGMDIQVFVLDISIREH